MRAVKTRAKKAAVPVLMTLAMSLLLVPQAGPITIRANVGLSTDYDADDGGYTRVKWNLSRPSSLGTA